jgi:hypothetical protein
VALPANKFPLKRFLKTPPINTPAWSWQLVAKIKSKNKIEFRKNFIGIYLF